MIPVHRPRNVDWRRGAALLYGDWGTSKSYVLGIGFAIAGYSSLPMILTISILICIVGINYLWVCRNFPDGGGVFSCARPPREGLAAVGRFFLFGVTTVRLRLG